MKEQEIAVIQVLVVRRTTMAAGDTAGVGSAVSATRGEDLMRGGIYFPPLSLM